MQVVYMARGGKEEFNLKEQFEHAVGIDLTIFWNPHSYNANLVIEN